MRRGVLNDEDTALRAPPASAPAGYRTDPNTNPIERSMGL
jgi:hypothetical protein